MSRNSRNLRRFFRLPYPLSDRPTLSVGERLFEVSELSEQGLRLYHQNAVDLFQQGEPIEAVLTFQDGHRVTINATVGRMNDVDLVLIELAGVSFARMVKEQRQLIRKYGNFLKK